MNDNIKINVLLKVIIFIILVLTGCSDIAPTVEPASINTTVTTSEPGISDMNAFLAYPTDGSSDVPVDANIVIVFSNTVDFTTVAANISIDNGATYPAPGTDSKVITLNPTTDLTPGTLYTVTLNTGVTSTAAEGTKSVDQIYTWNFTTELTSTTTYPRVIPGTQSPTGGTVNINTPYVEVTFTKPVVGVDGASFTITPAVIGSSVSQVGGTNTYRIDFVNPMAYNTLYTVDLTPAITDGTYPLIEDGEDTWTFTTETDPASGGTTPTTTTNINEDTAATNSIWISFNTDMPFTRLQTYVQYGTTSGTYGTNTVETDWDGDGIDEHSYHRIQLTGLTPNTLYYYRVWIDIDNSGGYTVGDLASAEYSFFTAPNVGTGGKVVTDVANDQGTLKSVQNSDGSSYIFWIDNSTDIQAQYFDTTGTPQWGVDGSDITSSGSAFSSINVLNSRYTNDDAIIIGRRTDNDILYAKMVYNGLAYRWGGPAGSDGTSVSVVATQTGSGFSAALVHERPTVKVTGQADMPDDGVATNLLFDRDVDFSGLSLSLSFTLAAGDLLLTNTAGINWNSNNIQNQNTSPTDIFEYVLKTNLNSNLGAYTNYYLADTSTNVITGISGHASTDTTHIRSSFTDLTSVVAGDIIVTGDSEWGLANGAGIWNGGCPCYEVEIDRTLTLLAQFDSFTIYRNHEGPFTSEAVSNPLWDRDPSVAFNPGVTVLADDIVINENNNSVAATKSEVVNPLTGSESNYALELNADIIDDNDFYAILSLPSGATYVAAGYSTSTTAFRLVDTNTDLSAGITKGDIVYNIDQDISAEIISLIDANNVELSADIFTAASQKYVIYTKRAFMVVYIDTADDLKGRVFNLASGAAIGGEISIDTGTFSNPVAVSDEAGRTIVFYEGSGNIHAKSIAADGTESWARTNILTSYSITQVLPDRATSGVGGAYLLADNGSGSIRIVRINGSTGATRAGFPVSITGYNPDIAVDKSTNGINRILIAYENNGGDSYSDIVISSYNPNGSSSFAATRITSDLVSYYCLQPKLVVSDTTSAGNDTFYAAWYDGRYYSTVGYQVYAQRFNSDGTKSTSGNWDNVTGNELFIMTPSTYGIPSELDMKLLFYDDDASTAPFGIIPVWLDFRNSSVTGTDIYYQEVQDDGILP